MSRPTIPELRYMHQCPVPDCDVAWKSNDSIPQLNADPHRTKFGIWYELPLCEKCKKRWPDGHESQKLWMYRRDVREAHGITDDEPPKAA